jgi:hypothetical protein
MFHKATSWYRSDNLTVWKGNFGVDLPVYSPHISHYAIRNAFNSASEVVYTLLVAAGTYVDYAKWLVRVPALFPSYKPAQVNPVRIYPKLLFLHSVL